MIINLLLPGTQQPDLLSLEFDTEFAIADLLTTVNELINAEHATLYKDGKELNCHGTLRSCGIADNDVLVVVVKPSTPQQPPEAERYNRLAERIRQTMSNVAGAPPPAPHPDSAEGQEMIMNAIKQQAINKNLEEASQLIPESFVQVTMLYVELKVNGVEVQAFVDSGAQASIMSRSIAAECNLTYLIDERYSGIARGVGEAKIVGRIHRAEIEASGVEFDASFIVLEQATDHPLLFGLDLLYRHRCCIDLEKRVLRIGNIVELPFLDQAHIKH